MFDVQGTNEGPGELWVIVRQGPTKLATLVLRPRIVGIPAPSVRRIGAAADSPPAEVVPKTLPVLQIFERRNGDSLGYLFALDMGDGIFLKGDSPSLKLDRAVYVADMYDSRFRERLASEQFSIEGFGERARRGISYSPQRPEEGARAPAMQPAVPARPLGWPMWSKDTLTRSRALVKICSGKAETAFPQENAIEYRAPGVISPCIIRKQTRRPWWRCILASFHAGFAKRPSRTQV
jgi:hypothetical protein